MAHANLNSNPTGIPPLDKFIVALFLVKSKPATDSVREYLANLHNFFREGRRPRALDISNRHIDSVTFWKSSYEKSEQAQASLKIKIEELEQRLQRQIEPSLQACSQSKLQKRKRDGTNTAEKIHDEPRKKAKTTDHETTSKVQRLSLDDVGSGFRVSEDPQSNDLLQGFYLLQQATSQKKSGKEIQSLIIRVLLAMRSVVTGVQTDPISSASVQLNARSTATRTQERNAAHQQAKVEVQIEDKLTAIARFFPVVMQVLQKLGQTSEGTKLQGQPIYHTVLLFQRLLEQISTISKISITQRRLRRGATPKSKTSQGRIERQIADYLLSPKATRTMDVAENGKTIKLLKQLAMSMITALGPLKTTENEILDGILFFLLNQTGNLLREFVFEDDKENTKPHMEPINTEDVGSREAQAPHLIHLLRHAMRITPKEPGCAIVTRQNYNMTSPRLQSPKSHHNDFATEARIKLQNTMLRGFFGADAKGLGEGLPMPVGEDSECSGTDNEREINETVKGWYISEVWKLVGWDILRESVQ
ncbi:MAG: hypothetical protein Q9191_002039 [Dirinaria sp. TL-2023a]